MAIYLDSAVLDEARLAKESGWVYGVTTNPALMAKAGVEPEAVLLGLAKLGFRQVYYQLVSNNLDDMLLEARKAAEIVTTGLICKILPTDTGFRFVARYGNKIPCCLTAIFDPAQALVAREAGAKYIAVYVNRAKRQLGDGLGLVSDIAKMLAGGQTEIVAASLKSKTEAVEALAAGAQHITVPFDLLMNLPINPWSSQTVEQFNAEGVGIRLNSKGEQ